MNAPSASTQSRQYELHSELARLCLPSANADPNRRLAWVNSVCFLFLLIGLVGAKPESMVVRRPPPMEQVIPAIVEPPPPPKATPQEIKPDDTEQEKPSAPQVVIAAIEAPSISFSVPTIANLVAPKGMVAAPPLAPMQPVVPVKRGPMALDDTGKGQGDRPRPEYPKLAKEQGIQGAVTLLMEADAAGNILQVTVTKSSGATILDNGAANFVKRHWILPSGGGLFQTSIRYSLIQ